ncbi:unnamed protein product, partial [Trichogramma brassicae]
MFNLPYHTGTGRGYRAHPKVIIVGGRPRSSRRSHKYTCIHVYYMTARTNLKSFHALPKQGPQITGLTQQYALGENVTANCTAWPSVPKAQLKWTINNKTNVRYMGVGGKRRKYRIGYKRRIPDGIILNSLGRGIGRLTQLYGAKTKANITAKLRGTRSGRHVPTTLMMIISRKQKGGPTKRVVPYDYVVQHPTHQPIESQGTPNSIGLRFTIDNRYLKTASYLGALRIRCVALVGSRRFETEQPVMLAHANNQRFSAGDLRSRAPSAAYSLALLLLGTFLTTTAPHEVHNVILRVRLRKYPHTRSSAPNCKRNKTVKLRKRRVFRHEVNHRSPPGSHIQYY